MVKKSIVVHAGRNGIEWTPELRERMRRGESISFVPHPSRLRVPRPPAHHFVCNARFPIIYSDPAWVFDDEIGSRGAASRYERQSAEDLKALPVGRLASANSLHFMWCVSTHLKLGIELLETWGFAYVDVVFVWAKKTSRGNRHFGLGRSSRKETELCLLGRRGNGLPRRSASVRQLIEAPLGEHSAKPPETRDRIVQLYGDVQRIELNARARAAGWHAHGYGVGAGDQELREVLLPPLEKCA